MASNARRDAVCMAGIGTTAYGSFPKTDSHGLGSEALLNAAVARSTVGTN